MYKDIHFSIICYSKKTTSTSTNKKPIITLWYAWYTAIKKKQLELSEETDVYHEKSKFQGTTIFIKVMTSPKATYIYLYIYVSLKDVEGHTRLLKQTNKQKTRVRGKQRQR